MEERRLQRQLEKKEAERKKETGPVLETAPLQLTKPVPFKLSQSRRETKEEKEFESLANVVSKALFREEKEAVSPYKSLTLTKPKSPKLSKSNHGVLGVPSEEVEMEKLKEE